MVILHAGRWLSAIYAGLLRLSVSSKNGDGHDNDSGDASFNALDAMATH